MTTYDHDDGLIGTCQHNWKNLLIGALCWLCLFSFIAGYKTGSAEQKEADGIVVRSILDEHRLQVMRNTVRQVNLIKRNRTYSEWQRLKFRASEWGVSVTF